MVRRLKTAAVIKLKSVGSARTCDLYLHILGQVTLLSAVFCPVPAFRSAIHPSARPN